MFSDHVPIVLKLCNINLTTYTPTIVEKSCDKCETHKYYKWKADYPNVFQNNMNDDYVCCKLGRIIETLDKDTDLILDIDAEKCINELNDVLDYVSKPLLHTFGEKKGISKQNSHNTWYDDDCKEKR